MQKFILGQGKVSEKSWKSQGTLLKIFYTLCEGQKLSAFR